MTGSGSGRSLPFVVRGERSGLEKKLWGILGGDIECPSTEVYEGSTVEEDRADGENSGPCGSENRVLPNNELWLSTEVLAPGGVEGSAGGERGSSNRVSAF